MESSMNIEMPTILDCLRKDIYSLISKLELPQDQQVQLGQLVEQIRLEENKYHQDIQRLLDGNRSHYEMNMNSLRQKCNQLEEKVKEMEYKEIRTAAENEFDNKLKAITNSNPISTLDAPQLQQLGEIVTSMRRIKESLLSISMETRLSVEMEMQDTKTTLSQVSSSLQTIVDKYHQLNSLYINECTKRRKIFNDLQELKGSIRVFCRIRPLIAQECSSNQETVIEAIDDSSLQIQLSQNSVNSGKGQRRTDKIYEFDRVFDEHSTQAQIFTEMEGLITSVLDGFSACVFAYGQTGSGKTFTMEGESSPELEGVIPRTLNSLCSAMKERPDIQYQTTIRMLEIYNEKIFDLLSRSSPVEARLDQNGHVLFPSAVSMEVSTVDEMRKVLSQGNDARRVAATSSNEHSSRSHMLFILTVSALNASTNQKSEGRLVLVDLAGSERVSKTESTGQRLVEGQYINKSLSSLGDVIHALNNKHKHIPFRNSTLTFILQDVLTEGNKVLMIAQLSPASNSSSESLQTLEFANRVNKVVLGKGIENKTHVMIGKLNTTNTRLKAENDELREELHLLKDRSSLSQESNSQLEKRIQTLNTLLAEKSTELMNKTVRLEELEAEVAGKSRLLQDRNNEINELKSRLTNQQHEPIIPRGSHLGGNEGSRDSFGSFIDNSSSVVNRRFSTIGLTRASHGDVPHPSPPAERIKLQGPPEVEEKKSTKRSYVAMSSAPAPAAGSVVKQPRRRISLIERSRMMSHSASSSGVVSGSVRLTTAPRRQSVFSKKTQVAPKEDGGSSMKENPQEKPQTTVIVSPSKKRRYTVNVARSSVVNEPRPSYTYTPSTDRRVTLNTILSRANRNSLAETGTNTSVIETTSFLSSTAYRKPENPSSFLSSGSTNTSFLGNRN